jgi:hypothetical protein
VRLGIVPRKEAMPSDSLKSQEALMDIYDEINIINDFQKKFGMRQSVRRACDLLVSYIGGLQKSLPEIAAQGFNVAIKCKEGSVLPDEVETARMQIVDSLRELRAYYNQYPMEHTVSYILRCYRDLAHERGLASYSQDFPYEFVFYSLERIDTFESNHELFRILLKEYFSS